MSGMKHKNITSYFINTSEISSELSREDFISSQVKITCYLHTWRDHRRYSYIINRAFFTGVYIIMRSLMRYRVEHSKIKFISTREHVISSIYYINTSEKGAISYVTIPTVIFSRVKIFHNMLFSRVKI